MISAVSPELLIPVGRMLLLGTSGYAIYQVVRGEYEFEDAIIGIVVGVVGIELFQDGFHILQSLSGSLETFLMAHLNRDSLKEQLLAAIRSSPSAAAGRLPTEGEFFGQIWRAGLWGAISSIVDLLFILADILIEASQKVFFNLILLIFPLGCGLFPLFPGILSNMVVYAIELSFWRPMIILVHQVTSSVGRDYMANDSTQGLKIVAVEVVAVLLILSIPAVTHKVMSGALSGDFGSSGSMVRVGRKLYGSLSSALGSVMR